VENNTSEAAPTQAKTARPRSLNPHDEGPWGWFAKAAIRRLREAFDNDRFLDQVLALYLAHCEIASDNQSPTYTVSRRELVRRSGVSLRRVSEIHERLRSIGLLTWEQNIIPGSKELGANTFTLMSCNASTTSCTASTRLCKNAKPQICTVGKESQNKLIEKFNENGRESAASRLPIPPSMEQVTLQGAIIGLPDIECEKFFHFYESIGWMVAKNKMKSVEAKLRHWKIKFDEENTLVTERPNIRPAEQARALEAILQKHPCNKDWSGYDATKATPELKEDYRSKRKLRDELNSLIANGGKP
jgi:hypothetical protein